MQAVYIPGKLRLYRLSVLTFLSFFCLPCVSFAQTAMRIQTNNPLTRGLQHWWLPLARYAGNYTIADLIGRSNGTLTSGAALALADQDGYDAVITFDGVNDTVQTTQKAGLTHTSAFTLCASVLSTSNTSDIILSTAIGSGNFDGIWMRWGSSATNNRPRLALNSAAGTFEEILTDSGTILSLNTWYNLCMDYDGSQTIAGMRIIINGALAGITTGSDTGFGSFTDRIWVMGAATDNTFPFAGKIRNVQVYTRQLSLTEHQQRVRAGPPTFGGLLKVDNMIVQAIAGGIGKMRKSGVQ